MTLCTYKQKYTYNINITNKAKVCCTNRNEIMLVQIQVYMCIRNKRINITKIPIAAIATVVDEN